MREAEALAALILSWSMLNFSIFHYSGQIPTDIIGDDKLHHRRSIRPEGYTP